MNAAGVKEQVWALADELNTALGVQVIQPNQQTVSARYISLTCSKPKERLYITPVRDSYQVALSGKPLIARMELFMKQLTGTECNGYKHKDQDSPQPYWYISDYAQVREAAYFYAGAALPCEINETIDLDIVAITQRQDIQPTQREALIQARLGQGAYRKQMLALWDGKCAVTGLSIQSAIIASHAKPWAGSSDVERLDPYNGLPLMASLDKLFDQYLITFSPITGEMSVSPKIEEADRIILGVPANLRKIPCKKLAHYLSIHFEKFELQSKS